MSDRPLTLVLIAVAILAALYLRRARVHRSFDVTGQRQPTLKETLSVDQMKREGAARGIVIDFANPMTREQFERLMGPVSVK